MIAMTIEITTQITIKTCMTIQNRGSSISLLSRLGEPYRRFSPTGVLGAQVG